MKKILKYFNIFVLTFLLSFGCFYSKPVIADSGFDSSWSDGGSSGHSWSSHDHSWSSHDYDSNSHSSGSISGDSIVIDGKGIAFMILILSSVILGFILYKVYSDNHSKLLLIIMFLYIIITLFIGYLLINTTALIMYAIIGLVSFQFILDHLKGKIISLFGSKKRKVVNKTYFDNNKYSSFNTKELQDELFNIYKSIQLAWAQNDIEPVRNKLTDELFNSYKMQINTMLTMKQRNVMEDINFVKMNVIDLTRKNNIEQVTVTMEVTCKDYLVQDDDGKEILIKGSSSGHMKYIYKMTFVRNITKVTTKCPNCGKELNNAMSTKCNYCGGIVIHETDQFVLSKKEMLAEERI